MSALVLPVVRVLLVPVVRLVFCLLHIRTCEDRLLCGGHGEVLGIVVLVVVVLAR